MKSPHMIGSGDQTAVGISPSVHARSDDEIFFGLLLKAKEELKKEEVPVTVAALAKKIGRAYETVNKFLKTNLTYKHRLKVVAGKKGPKRSKKA